MRKILCVCLLLLCLLPGAGAEGTYDEEVKTLLQAKNGNFTAFDRLLSDYLTGELEKKLSGDFCVEEAAAAPIDEMWRLIITGYYKEAVPFRFNVSSGEVFVGSPEKLSLWEGDADSRYWTYSPDASEDQYALLKSIFEDYLFQEYPYAQEAISEKRALTPLDRITRLQQKKGSFTKNKRYDVYQGPGTVYGRSGGGKGVVSTNGAIHCYGTENGWLLIEYEISKGKHRYGWISLNALPSSQANAYERLNFSRDGSGSRMHICGVLIQDTTLTDDPFYSKNAVKQLPAGTSVFVLMRDKDFLLVEGFLGKERFMGFVPADAVEMRYGYAENAKITIDKAVTFTEDEIYAAAEAVKDIVYERFSGTSIVEIKYIEAESADADDWWQPEVENREGMQLFVDLNGMSFYDFEIAAYGVAKDYGFILYRDKNGGEWEVGNWGYE